MTAIDQLAFATPAPSDDKRHSSPMATSGNPITVVCACCGSKNVARDAWAEWDEKDQRWVLRGDPFDAATCFVCDSETSLEAVALVDNRG